MHCSFKYLDFPLVALSLLEKSQVDNRLKSYAIQFLFRLFVSLIYISVCHAFSPKIREIPQTCTFSKQALLQGFFWPPFPMFIRLFSKYDILGRIYLLRALGMYRYETFTIKYSILKDCRNIKVTYVTQLRYRL